MAHMAPLVLKRVSPKVACTIFSLGSAAAMSTMIAFSGGWEPYLYAFLSSCTITTVETVSTSALITAVVAEDVQGTMYGLESALLNAGLFLGPPLGGIVFKYSSYAPYH